MKKNFVYRLVSESVLICGVINNIIETLEKVKLLFMTDDNLGRNPQTQML